VYEGLASLYVQWHPFGCNNCRSVPCSVTFIINEKDHPIQRIIPKTYTVIACNNIYRKELYEIYKGTKLENIRKPDLWN
jgi:hypothetical protein